MGDDSIGALMQRVHWPWGQVADPLAAVDARIRLRSTLAEMGIWKESA
jgi:hypothetical protein